MSEPEQPPDRPLRHAAGAAVTLLSRLMRGVSPYPHLRDRPPSPESSAPGLPGGDSLADSLKRLAPLHASGALTDEEFRAAEAATLREGAGR